MKYLSGIGMAILVSTLCNGAIIPSSLSNGATYTMHGEIKGMEGWIFIMHRAGGPTDSAAIHHGRFQLTGTVEETEFCQLVFKTVPGNNFSSRGFFLQAGDIGITGTKDSLDNLSFTGAPAQEEYLQYQQLEMAHADWNTWNAAYRDAEKKHQKARADSLVKEAQILEGQQKDFAREYAATHPASYVSIVQILSYFSYNPDADTLQHIYDGLAPQIQSSYLGKELKSMLDAALLTAIGRPAPEFTQNDTKGKPVTLSSLRGQYVLIDFWASWCGPCRAENPNVLKSYRNFHSKGFTILGVSLDDNKDKWLGAIRQDGMPWTQVSDMKGWKNEAAVQYGVQGIPMNFLLDRNGTIVAKGLRGPDLDKKLEELVH